MVKILVSLMIIYSLFSSISVSQAKVTEEEQATEKKLYDPEMNCTSSVKLTMAQRKQLEQIYNRIYLDYSDLITTYTKAGALTPYQTKIRYIMLNNYIKTFFKRNYTWCSEHEADEWEEEWYNNDND